MAMAISASWSSISWMLAVQLVTTANTGIKSVEDLKGKRVGVGAPNSGVEINADGADVGKDALQHVIDHGVRQVLTDQHDVVHKDAFHILGVVVLKGKRVGVGAPNSGVEINARMVLDAYGITYDHRRIRALRPVAASWPS